SLKMSQWYSASQGAGSRVDSPAAATKWSSLRDVYSTSSFQHRGHCELSGTCSFNKKEKDPVLTHEHLETPSPGSANSAASPTQRQKSVFPREKDGSPELCETPKVRRKASSLRRRLNFSFTLLKRDSDPQSSSLESNVSHVLSLEKHIPDSTSGFPKQDNFSLLVTSTIKTEDVTSSSQNSRLSFSQHKTSTIDDSTGECDLFEVECLSPIQGNDFKGSMTHDFSDSSLSVSDENTCPELLGSFGSQTTFRADVTTSVTPVSSLISKLRFKGGQTLSSTAEVRDSVSTPEDSGFSSLSWDKLEDSISDQEGSLQELFQKHKGTPRVGNLVKKPKHLGRLRRLSTLREQGSQSETEDEQQVVPPNSGISEGQGGSSEKTVDLALSFKTLSNTPALQLVHELFMQSKRKRFQQEEDQEFFEERDEGKIDRLQCVLAGLIGKKMGIEQLDILTELQYRNLKHILAMVLDSLSSESLYRWQTCLRVESCYVALASLELYVDYTVFELGARVTPVDDSSESALFLPLRGLWGWNSCYQENYLATDGFLVDYFNEFLSLPTFSEAIRFNVDYGVFEVINDAPQLLEKQLKRILQSQQPRNPIYDVIRKGKSDAQPLQKSVPSEDEAISVNYTIMCLNREQGIKWIKRKRLPAFLESDCYFEYRLAKLISQATWSSSGVNFIVGTNLPPWILRKSSTPPPPTVKEDNLMIMKKFYISLGQASYTQTKDWFTLAKESQKTVTTFSLPCCIPHPKVTTPAISSVSESFIFEDGIHPRTTKSPSKTTEIISELEEEEEEGSISIKDTPSQALLRIYLERKEDQDDNNLTLHFSSAEEFLNAYIIFILREAIEHITGHSFSDSPGYISFYNVSQVIFDSPEAVPSPKVLSSPQPETEKEISEEKLEKVSLSSKSESLGPEGRADWCTSHRTYDIGNRREFERFKKFLKGTLGERYWWLWMDIERLKVLKDPGRHQRLLDFGLAPCLGSLDQPPFIIG
ncbi:hypothetical protein STEG23_038267, partial [Scotinomys teguina]